MYFLELLIAGLVTSGVISMLGASVVVVYRGSGVPNFAAGAIGMMGTYAFYKTWPGHGVPWPVAMVFALVLSAALGVIVHLGVMRRLRQSSLPMKMIATLGLMTLLIALANQYLAPGGQVVAVQSFMSTNQLQIAKGLTVGVDQIWIVGVAAAVIAALLAAQKYSRFGLATSAVCEDEVVAAGMGWSPDVIASLNWALGSATGSLGLILLVPIAGLSPSPLALFVIPALGAALIGHFESLPLMVVGALIIGVGESEVGYVTSAAGWNEAFPLLVIILYLLWRGQELRDRSESGQRLASVSPGKLKASAVVFAVAATVLIATVSLDWLPFITTSMMLGLAVLSVVVLTGYAGQLSLAQYGLAGLSAFATALFSVRFGLPMWLAIILAVIVTVGLGLALSIPALRTRGASLAIVTLNLVVVIEDLVLTNTATNSWLGNEHPIPALKLFGQNFSTFTHPRAFGFLILGLLTVCGLVVLNLRRSAMGRRLLAIRGNPQAAASVGVSPTAMKLYAFAVAAAIAGLCGALTESQTAFPDFTLFTITSSINVVLEAVIGGVGWVAGALASSIGATSGVMQKILSYVMSPSNWLAVITGAGVVLVVIQAPDGIVPNFVSQADFVRKWYRKARPSGRGGDTERSSSAKSLAAWKASGEADRSASRRPPAALVVEDLTVSFGGNKALSGASLTVNPGEVVGLIGPNGAGKSTFIDATCGAVKPLSGRVKLGDLSLDAMTPARRANQGLVRSFQSLELFEDMSVGENILVGSERPTWLRGVLDLVRPQKAVPSAAALLAVDDFQLGDVIESSPRTLDHGRRRLLAITRAFAANPAVILLDEPAAGLDPQKRAELGDLLRTVAKDWGLGVLLVEHDVNMVFQVCDRVVALVAGQVVAEGTPEEVRRNDTVLHAYLGPDHAPGPESSNGSGAAGGGVPAVVGRRDDELARTTEGD
jgi:sulfate-transporting ATPase